MSHRRVSRFDHFVKERETSTREQRHALVAEDDDAMRELVCDALEVEGFVVTAACSGSELRTLLDEAFNGRIVGGFDLVVTDVRMPECTGLEVLAELRERDWATPVILMTAFGDPKTHLEARRLGAVAVLDKPFALSTLRTVVQRIVPDRLATHVVHQRTDSRP